MRDFNGRVAVITGAASGIGRAVAAALAQRGCDVALVDIDEDRLTGTADLVRKAGRQASIHLADVSDRDRMQTLPAEIEKDHGRVDIMVNNAGVSVAATLEEHSIEDFQWLVGVNLWGVVYGCKFFLPLLKSSDDAYIVNISSMFGLVGVPSQSSYCATKFAVRGFSEAIGYELANSNVRVMSVHPGGIKTNIIRATRWAPGREAAQKRTVRFFERRAMPPERAASLIIKAMRNRASRLLITREAFLADYIKRLFPSLAPRGLVSRAYTWLNRAAGPNL